MARRPLAARGDLCESGAAMLDQALPAELPRALHVERFMTDPLDHLREARRTCGDAFVLLEDGPLFSRAADCAGVIAVCGHDLQRAVLSDIESFGLPVSAARTMGLPESLVNLNRSLHSMTGDRHAIQKRLLARALREPDADRDLVLEAIEDFSERWMGGYCGPLLAEMRELMLRVAARMMLGRGLADRAELATLAATYFHLRREAATPGRSADEATVERLVEVGRSLDAALRDCVRACREHGSPAGKGVLGRLATVESESCERLDEDAVVGHGNILFVSILEPVAVALTWIMIVLSQLPRLRDDLRDELASVPVAVSAPPLEAVARLVRLDGVVRECLRLLPPNAFMVRVTRRRTCLGGVTLPAGCEVVVCPLLSHRDDASFPNPDAFRPDRWRDATPSPYVYFPFGAGGHACVGAGLAMYLLKVILAWALPRFDLVLAGDRDLDWRLHITFMPSDDPVVIVTPLPSAPLPRAGRLGGPVAKLVGLGAERGRRSEAR